PTPQPRKTIRVAGNDGTNLSRYIAAYLAKLPNLSEGQGRDDVAFAFACLLLRDLALDRSVALEWLLLWDQGNRPPKGRARLEVIMETALACGQSPVGCGRVIENTTRNSRRSWISPGKQPGHVTLRCRVEVF